MSTKLVNNIIFGKKFCRLCFGDVYDDDLNLYDEINLDSKSEKISQMLTYLLGGKYTSNMTDSDSFCSNCAQSLENSYNFTRMCKDNSERLEKTITTLNEALQSAECSDTSKSVLIQIDTNDYTFMQFYQYQRPVRISPSAVKGHSKYLINRTSTRQYKPSVQVDDNTVISGHTVLDTDSKDKSVLEENTTMAVEIESSSTELKSETEVNTSLEARQHRLKMLIQNHSQQNLRKHNLRKQNFLKQQSYNKISNQIPQAETKPVAKITKKQSNKLSLATDELLSIIMEKKKYVCNECEKTYSCRTSILNHIRSAHSHCKPFVCKYCADTFKCPYQLKRHIRHKHVEPSAQCDICNAKFKQLDSIYKHRKRHFDPKSTLYVQNITKRNIK